MRKILLTIFAIGFVGFSAHSEGYQVNLQGQKQIGMGHAGTSLSLDASSIHFNPAGLGFLEPKFSFSGGVSLIRSYNVYQPTEPSTYKASTDNPIGTPFYFYGSGKINENFSVGLGITTPYGNRLAWEDDWAGRYLIQNIAMQAFFFQPTVAYKINDQFSLGAGLIYAIGSVELSKALPLPGPGNVGEASVTLKGSASAIGGNFGFMYRPNPKVSFGLNYKTEMMIKVKDGDATFKTSNTFNNTDYFPKDNKFDAELPFPSSINFGVSFSPTDKLLVAADINYIGWSAYEKLNFDFKTETKALADSKNPREWDNTLIYRLGAQYKATDILDLRAGLYYDSTPIQDTLLNPETPGANKIGMSCGFSVKPMEKLSIDASFLYIKGLEREAEYKPSEFKGTYNTAAFIFGLGVTYNF